MPLTAGAGEPRSARGFGLVEVLAAATVVALTVAAVTGAVVAAGRGQARGAAADAAERALRAEAARLRALPFCPPGPVATAAGTLVGEVFPRADPRAADGDAWYVTDADRPPPTLLEALPPAARAVVEAAPRGSFVTVADADDHPVLLRVAAFVGADGVPLGDPAVRGWDAAHGAPPPAAAVAVDLVAAGRRGALRRVALVFTALPAVRATAEGEGP